MTLFSSAGSRNYANHSATQASDLGRKTTATSGQRCLGQFEKFNHVGSWAKTFSALLIGMEGWYSSRCRLTWKMKGTKYNRMYFRLVPSTLPIEGTGFGLLPTPVASDIEGGISNPNQISKKNGRYIRTSDNTGTEFGAKLRDVAQLLPTPQTQGLKVCNQEGKTEFMDLGMLPTPATRDHKGARSSEALEAAGRNGTNSMPDAFAQTGTSSQLNPRFVGEMMGFPPTHTEEPFKTKIQWIDLN